MEQQTIYIFFGLIASGKSTLAKLFAEEHGFSYYNTDRVRKELAGIAATERRSDGMGQGIYSPEFTEKTYQAMLARTELDLHQGTQGVVIDGSYSKETDRHKVRELADSLSLHGQTVRTLFILCSCSDEETKRRLDLRAQNPEAVSDGRWEIFVRQKEKFTAPDELSPDQLVSIDTEEKLERLLKSLNPSKRNRAC
jgi:predicted kinase